MSELVCWKCGADLNGLPLPLSRRDVCASCGTDLHVCKMCELYDTSRSKACYEPVVEEVRDKEKANFCDYFKVKTAAYDTSGQTRAQQAKTELDSLFGGDAQQHEDSQNNTTSEADALESLFKKPGE